MNLASLLGALRRTPDTTQSQPATTANHRPARTESAPRRDCYTPGSDCGSSDTYRMTRQTRLDYQMRLEFNLGAISQTAQQIADGDTVTLESLAAAGFGLSTSLDVSGYSRLEESGTGQAESGRSSTSSRSAQTAAAQFGAQSRDFALESFLRESTAIHQSLNTSVRDNYRQAVNRLSLRYRMDSGMSLSLLNRFNQQTSGLAESSPAQLAGYADATGALATGGTTDMLSAFFDAVDQYLDQAEAQLEAKAADFMTLATEQLGLSSEAVALVGDKLSDAIDSFFGKVETALGELAAAFGTDSAALTSAVDPVLEAPEAYA